MNHSKLERTVDKGSRRHDHPVINDAPINGKAPFGYDYVEHWQKVGVKNPEAAMEEALRCMNMLRDRRPFDRELWTAFAEVGRSTLRAVSPRLRDAFLRVTSRDRCRKLDLLEVCRSRMTIFHLMAQQNPHLALRSIARELGTLPGEDTFVHSPGAVRTAFTADGDHATVYDAYRLNLDELYAQTFIDAYPDQDHTFVIRDVRQAVDKLRQRGRHPLQEVRIDLSNEASDS